MARAVLTTCLGAALLAVGGAQAADLGPSARIVTAAPTSVWLGHFSGGRNLAPGADPMPIDWTDVKQRFATLGDCAHWLKDMRRAYPTYEGWKTCLPIR